MKYGAHVFLWEYPRTDDDHARLLDKCGDLGLSFLEISTGDDNAFDPALLGRRAREAGLELVVGPGGVWPMECDISLPEPDCRRAGLEWHKRALDVCGACGAIAYAGATYGHPGRSEYRPPCPDQRRRVAEGLHELAEYAADRNVRLLIEPMSHFRTHLANTPRQINELRRLADHPNLYSLLDTFHVTTEVADFAEAIAELMPHLFLLHACDSNRGAPGTALLPWDAIVGALIEHGWDGYIGFEGYNSTWRDGAFAYSRGMFHNVCPDGDAFVRAGKTFLEDTFARLRG